MVIAGGVQYNGCGLGAGLVDSSELAAGRPVAAGEIPGGSSSQEDLCYLPVHHWLG